MDHGLIVLYLKLIAKPKSRSIFFYIFFLEVLYYYVLHTLKSLFF